MNPFLNLLFLIMAIPAAAQPHVRNVGQEARALKNILLQHHVDPKVVDDHFSRLLFDKLFDDFDPERLIFTETDIAWLKPFEESLDDEINLARTAFINRFSERYRSGLERSERITKEILDTPLNWKERESFRSPEGWTKNEADLIAHHRRLLKFQVLERLEEKLERDSLAMNDFFVKHIDAALAHVKNRTLRPLMRLLTDKTFFDDRLADTFLQGIAGVFDPHSSFFSVRNYNDFVASLSTEDYYFGFTLGEDTKGNVVISALAPGGAAWKSGALHVSDILLAVEWEGEEAVDLGGMNIDDVNEVLDQRDARVVTLVVQGVDGKQSRVRLKKEKLQQEEDVVQSFVLDGEVKAGYIYLPDFYTRWNDESAGGQCANDVAKEIIKLKREGIDGLILDLRFNGGGSLYEAAAMAGIFIDEGPLAMVSARERKGATLKDMNRGTVYDGPLVVMVNGASASASEVLAGTLQDYNRGLVVGSRTYGKATGQNIIPTDEGVSKKNNKDAGFVKVTTQKLYRVTGRSAQGHGVHPDIPLPDVFAALDLGEERLTFALAADSVPANAYFKPMPPVDKNFLQRQSRQRVTSHPAFAAVDRALGVLTSSRRHESEPQSLVWEDFWKVASARKKDLIGNEKEENAQEKPYTVNNSQAKLQRLALDEYARSTNERWMELLSDDFYLGETYLVLRDLIALKRTE